MSDDLAGLLESSMNVTLDPLSTSKQHPRYSQFKQKSHKASQEERRRLTLEIQKKKRYDFQNHVRRLTDNDFSTLSEEDAEEAEEEMDWLPPKIKTPRDYKNQIMLSEWLVDIPTDLESNWLMVPCPQGKRCLVVASQGRTKVYAKSGFKIAEFPSHLPGGHYTGRSKWAAGTILDCLWNERSYMYYVLDVQCWNGLPLLGCEAQLRFCWLQSKFKEEPQLGQKSQTNRYPFVGVPFVPCDPQSMHNLMQETASSSEGKSLDGLLFYHKLGFYTPGTTPLVGWLKPYMVHEILNVPVPELYLTKKPAGYTNIQQHISKKPKAAPRVGKIACQTEMEAARPSEIEVMNH